MYYTLQAHYKLITIVSVSDHVGYTTAEMDSVILAWEAKTRYTRARPTQLVNDGNSGFSNTINSWDCVGYGPIVASQWDAMIRVKVSCPTPNTHPARAASEISSVIGYTERNEAR